MRRCTKCDEMKPAAGFYRHPRGRNGLMSACRECTKAAVKANRKKRVAHYREWERKRANDPTRVAARKAYAASDIGKAKARRAAKSWVARNAEKKHATTALNNAIRDGRMVKEPCFVCGTTDRVQGHHEDYSKPLDVLWLCPKHHAARHKAIRQEQREAA